jgi:hypothetical protein
MIFSKDTIVFGHGRIIDLFKGNKSYETVVPYDVNNYHLYLKGASNESNNKPTSDGGEHLGS